LNYNPEEIDSIAAGFSKDPQRRLRVLRHADFIRFQLAKREGFLIHKHSDKSKKREMSSGILHYLLWCRAVSRPYVEVALSGKYAKISYNCDPTGDPYTCNPTDADLEYFQSLLDGQLVAEDAEAALGHHHTEVWGVHKDEAVVIARQIAAVLIARTRMTAEERDEFCRRYYLDNSPPPPNDVPRLIMISVQAALLVVKRGIAHDSLTPARFCLSECRVLKPRMRGVA